MDAEWAHDAIVYHLYPLGACGAPARNDHRGAPVPRLAELPGWIAHWHALGIDTLYLGPVFESTTHGYDTVDYFQVDRRLGDNATLAEVCRQLKAAGIRVILDAVFNHVGRGHAAFQDLRRHGEQSRFRGWFKGLRFDKRSPLGDAFDYETWAGAYELVKLDLAHPEVRAHLLAAVDFWIDAFGIDGLRLDAADVMDLDFLRELAAHCKARKPDFWLMGEVVHGDYARWANPDTLHATTNYACYAGLHGSANTRNYHEIAHELNRQFGPEGVYKGLPLYSFVDNHDVDRIRTKLKRPAHLFPLHVLLFTMPGVPSVYYGSEWAQAGKKGKTTDAPLRPIATPPMAGDPRTSHDLAQAIARLSRVRHAEPILRRGDYRPIAASHEQLVFERRYRGRAARVAVNGADAPVSLSLGTLDGKAGRWVDLLNPGEAFLVSRGKPATATLWPHWGRVLVFEPAKAG